MDTSAYIMITWLQVDILDTRNGGISLNPMSGNAKLQEY